MSQRVAVVARVVVLSLAVAVVMIALVAAAILALLALVAAAGEACTPQIATRRLVIFARERRRRDKNLRRPERLRHTASRS
jgi:hypothetical protein